jgi:hypothetical protein
MTDYNDRRSIGIGVSIDTTSIPFRYPFFKSTADTDPILSIAIGDTIGTDSATDINNPAQVIHTQLVSLYITLRDIMCLSILCVANVF